MTTLVAAVRSESESRLYLIFMRGPLGGVSASSFGVPEASRLSGVARTGDSPAPWLEHAAVSVSVSNRAVVSSLSMIQVLSSGFELDESRWMLSYIAGRVPLLVGE